MGRKILILGFLILGILFLIGAVQIYANKKAEKNLQVFLNRLGLEGKTSYGRVNYSLFKGSTEVENLRISTAQGITTVEKVRILKISPNNLKFSLIGISSNSEDFRGFRKNMEELGYREIKINTYFSGKFSDAKKELFIEEWRVEVPFAFSMGVKMHLDRISRSLISSLMESSDNEESIKELSEKLGKVRIRSFEFIFKDAGIRKRLFEKKKVTPAEILQTLDVYLERNVKLDSLFREELHKALKEFLTKGGTLRIRSDPIPPIDFQTFVLLGILTVQSEDLSEFIYRLNLRVKYLP